MRDPEMVKRAERVFREWTLGLDGGGRMGADVLADFAANEVELAEAWLRRCFWRAQGGRDAAVARAEKAEAAHRATLDLYAKSDARADRAEARVRELDGASYAKPAPCVPKVGDRVLWCGERGLERVVVGVDPLRLFYLDTLCPGTADTVPGAYTYDGPATPEERKAAGLTEEPALSAPPAPSLEALRAEFMDACAASHTAAGPYAEVTRTAKALLAAKRAAKGA